MKRILYQIGQDVETGRWSVYPTDGLGLTAEGPDLPTVLRFAADALESAAEQEGGDNISK